MRTKNYTRLETRDLQTPGTKTGHSSDTYGSRSLESRFNTVAAEGEVSKYLWMSHPSWSNNPLTSIAKLGKEARYGAPYSPASKGSVLQCQAPNALREG